MKISEYIKLLREIKKEHGDLYVETYTVYGGRRGARIPQISYKKILKGRETKDAFWNKWEGEDRKGEKVCEV